MFSAAGDPLDLDTPVTFRRVRWQEGYDVREVDAFVHRALADLRSPAATMRARDVRAARFRPVRLREGYEMREVDDYLDALEQTLALRHPEPEDASAAERRSLLALLRGETGRQWTSRLTWALVALVAVLWLYAEALAPRWG
jgi:DivIVA domain-containing protein